MRLPGRVAVVTGAGSGIGRATAELFAREGARIAAVDRDPDALAVVEGAIRAAGGTARGVCVDVTDAGGVERAARGILGEHGRIDVLVTCAAISVGGTVTATPLEVWDRVFQVNVRGTYLWLKAVIPPMQAARRGSIVTVGSQLAVAGGRGNASYIASKGAVIALTRTVALDHAADGIRANVIVPGAIDTPMLERSLGRQDDPAAARERSRTRHAMARFGTPEEVARGALYLASDDSSFTTGTLLVVDGGWLAG